MLPLTTPESLAKLIDHPLVKPELTDEQVIEGLELAKRGGKNAKKRAKVAVARKLAVLMHRLWVTGEVYEPLGYHQRQVEEKKRAA